MGLFSYKEKRYGKFVFILIAIVLLALAGGSIFGGIYAVMHMSHWSKYLIIVVACIAGLLFALMGITMLVMSLSMINSWKSGRDSNKSKGVSNVRLCDKCGRVITKKAEFCEHCGAKQETGLGLKQCPECGTKNSGPAAFCEKCGHDFSKDSK